MAIVLSCKNKYSQNINTSTAIFFSSSSLLFPLSYLLQFYQSVLTQLTDFSFHDNTASASLLPQEGHANCNSFFNWREKKKKGVIRND